jgi:hypothetical protein
MCCTCRCVGALHTHLLHALFSEWSDFLSPQQTNVMKCPRTAGRKRFMKLSITPEVRLSWTGRIM